MKKQLPKLKIVELQIEFQQKKLNAWFLDYTTLQTRKKEM